MAHRLKILLVVVALVIGSFAFFAVSSVPRSGPASTPTLKASAVTPSIWYNYTDFFNVPFGEWFDMRTVSKYGDEPIGASCFNQTSVTDGICTTNVAGIPRVQRWPYMDWLGPSGTAAIYAPFRVGVNGYNQPGYNISQPVFLPVLNYTAAPGSTLQFNWYMQYLNQAQHTALTTSPLNCFASSAAFADDGYQLQSKIYLTLDNQEAARLFGSPATGTLASIRQWWSTNTLAGCGMTTSGKNPTAGPLEVNVNNWFTNTANGNKYDIYNGYDGAYSPLYTNITATVVSAGPTGLTHVYIEHGAWGTEALLDRLFYWGNASYVGNQGDSTKAKGWWGMENGWWEDMHYSGNLGSTGMNFTLKAVQQYLFQERAIPGPDNTFRSSTNLGDSDDIPVWTWGPMLLDYGVFSAQHPSEITRYTGTNYIKTTPGSGDYGTNTTFDYTPVSWAAKANEWWYFYFPTNSSTYFQNPATAAIPSNMPTQQLPPIASSLSFLKIFPSTYGTWDGTTGVWSVVGPPPTSYPNGSPGHYPYLPYPGIYFEPSSLPPTVTTSAPSSITTTGATLNGNLANLGSATSLTVGFLYGTDPTLATNTNTTPQTKTATGAFTQAVTGLTPATQYYVQAWANGNGFVKGAIVPFTTAGTPPTVSTSAATAITVSGATLNGDLTNLGTASTVTVGFLYGTSPTLVGATNTTPVSETAATTFSAPVTGLASGTLYYFRAWALGNGFATGSILSFTTGTSAAAPTVTTTAASGITTTGATINGDLTGLGTAATVTVGFLYGTDPTLATNTNTTPVSESALTTFSSALTGLSPGTLYYFQAWANGNGFTRGVILSFTTSSTPPSVTTTAATAVTTNGATLNGDLTALGTATSVDVGFWYGTDPTLATNTNTTPVAQTATGTFTAATGTLTPGTTYYVQAWANGQGFATGSILSFRTSVTPPTVRTDPATSITSSSAVLNGATTNFGTATSVTVGFWWGTDPTLATNTNASAGTQTIAGGFTAAVSSLAANTLYYYQAWADGQEFATGSIASFTTLTVTITPPSVTTSAASGISSSGATLNGATSSLGSAASVTVGFFYGPDPNLVTATNVTATTQTTAGAFNHAITGLTPGTNYYFRAWANGDGFVNGSIVSFTTLTPVLTPPTVTTSAASSVTQTTATLNGATSSLGSATSVTVGFLWGTSASLSGATNTTPTTQTTAGSFTAALSSLTAGTKYYFRAWANGDGFAQGSTLSFTTSSPTAATPPTVTTSAASGLSSSGATLNGNLGSLGTATSVQVGFLWGTDSALSGASNVSLSTAQTATGAFTSVLTGLTPGTTYYVEAWANGQGFAHGAIQSFTTPAAPPPPENTFLGMPATIGYAVVAVIIIAIVAVVALLLMRRRKQTPPTPPPPESP